jgi:hypothetical protein
MRYSVYDYTRRVYDYYDAPGPGGTHAGSPPMLRPLGELGVSPDRASWSLPMGARKVGSGDLPRGRIASLGGADLMADPMRLGVYAILAYLGWRALR